jgi:hypothetical protein
MNPIDYKVGQSFKPYEDNPLPLQNHSKLAMNANGHLLLIICLNNISQEEIRQLSNLPIMVRILDDIKGHMLPLFRLGGTDLIFETPFNPCVYDEDRVFIMASDEKLNMLAIEASKNIIVASRSFTLPRPLSRKLLINWLTAFEEKTYYIYSYNQWIGLLHAVSQLKTLWRFAGEQWELIPYDCV